MHHLSEALMGLHGRIDTPEPVVVLDTMRNNIERMQSFAGARGLALRPHVKTHKCIEIGRLQRDAGAAGITAGNVAEAEVFAAHGFDDIFLAYPVWAAGTKAARIRHLAETVDLKVGVDNRPAIDRLAVATHGSTRRLQVVVEVDCGAHRSGISPDRAGDLARYAAATGLDPVGVYTYPGHGGSARDARAAAARDQLDALVTSVRALESVGIESSVVSAGSTPTVQYVDGSPITEIRPGEYVFCDLDNLGLGACGEEQIALFVPSTVVSDNVPGQAIVDVGTKALGREGSPRKGYGRALGVEDGRLLRLNEYHGFLSTPDTATRPRVGGVLAIAPNHVCPVVNNFDELVVTDSRGGKIERWAVAARGGLS
ncbi:alanine racemase [Streptomyces sp. NPDC050433]|uniref:alanine racemase n=1 Tax=Streptomyces sp. NPDC050433 TaxID=3365615 RepID=UPI0037A0FC03